MDYEKKLTEARKHYLDYKKTLDSIEDKNSTAAIMLTGSISSLELLFPELKESEDERIRKWLMEMIEELRKANPTNADHNGMCSEALAWLEKQGEQKPYGQREECLDCQINYAGECKGSCAMKRGEQKLAWSEEDEKEFERLLNVLHANMYESFDNWLKSLKDRFLPQPKQEWSEKDEYYRNIILYCLNNESVGKADKENAISWLKSLKPQNRWKPSDEQIEALHYVTNFDYGGHKATLVSLYEQLKKLREE